MAGASSIAPSSCASTATGRPPPTRYSAPGLCLPAPPVSPAIGEAHYEEAELHRVRGWFDEAERAYAEGSAFGRRPEPGLALLRLAQGRADAARAMIARALEEEPNDPRLLEAAVTIALGRNDPAEARSFVGPLRQAAGTDVPALLEAITARAEGLILLTEGEPRQALRSLRAAFGLWRELDAPYDAALVRVAIAQACRALGDDETAELEIAAARRVFDALGAVPALPDWMATRPPATASARARSRCCGISPADGPIGRSPTSSGSASGPWTGT